MLGGNGSISRNQLIRLSETIPEQEHKQIKMISEFSETKKQNISTWQMAKTKMEWYTHTHTQILESKFRQVPIRAGTLIIACY